MMKKLLGYSCSTAQTNNDKLVLSLTDAMTPVVWVINLSETPSLLLKVEETDSNLFVLQKITQNSGTPTTEDLGYYEKKGHAIRAMENATRAMKVKTSPFTSLCRLTKAILAIIVILFLFQQSSNINFNPMGQISSFFSQNNENYVPPEAEAMIQPSIQPSSDPEAVGVPLSADAFLQQRKQSGRSF